MRVVIALCSVLIIASCVGAEEGGSRSGTKEREEKLSFTPSMCPTPDSRLYEKVTGAGDKCVTLAVTQESRSMFRDAQTIEEYRDFFKNFCQKQSLVRSCLAETTVNMEICRNETFLNTFKIYRDTIETFLNIGCDEDGERLATLWFELDQFLKSKQNNIELVRKCTDKFGLMIKELLQSEIVISSQLYSFHKEIVLFADCCYELELSPSLKNHSKFFTDIIINGMKCIHPRDGTLVPCVTIDASLISPTTVCDWKTTGTEMSLYDVLEQDSGTCILEFFRYSGESDDDNDKIRDIVKNECEYGVSLRYCYNTSRIISEMCLNEIQRNEFDLLGDFIRSAHEEACFEDGRRLLEIASEIHRLERTGHGHAVWDCVDVAISTRNVTDEHGSSSKNMRFYHEMEAFKGCLVDKLRGDQTSVVAATSLIDELLKKVKCVHPEEGTTVLCETLVNKV